MKSVPKLMPTLAPALLAALALAPQGIAQDNPVPSFGTFGGSVHRTYNYAVPYIFGNGSRIRVKWSKSLTSAPYAIATSVGRNALLMDENGDLYWQAPANSGVGNSGVFKTRASDGALLWNGPFADVNFGGFSPPIVGVSRVYAARQDAANPTVYALNKATGAVLWQSAPLPQPAQLGMSLYDGTLYGVTNSVGGVASVFAINADTGAILWTSPVSSFNGSERLGTTLVPNAFGPGVHGLYWMFDNRTPETSGIRGVPVSPAAAGTAVSLGATRTSFSHIIYDQPANALYAPHWSDYGTSIEAFRPNGQLLWVARTDEFGFSLNGGFTPAHVLRPGGNGLIFAGFEGDFWLLNNPGDLGGGPLPASSALWYFNGPNEASEARDGGLIIADPVSGQQVYITGTTANTAANYARRIVAHRVSTGERIFEYFVPGDSGALGFGAGTCFSPAVDSRGDLYFGMVSQAVAGGDPKLVALTVEPCLANCDNSTTPPILNAGDFTCLLNRFRAAQSLPAAQQVTDYTNCDQSTTPPVLNAGDFTCFLTKFRAGCP